MSTKNESEETQLRNRFNEEFAYFFPEQKKNLSPERIEKEFEKWKEELLEIEAEDDTPGEITLLHQHINIPDGQLPFGF